MRPLELYIHIPFCVKKCRYCDFLSAPATPEARQEYVMGLCQKIRSYYDLGGMYHVSSIFIGGGTPSILETQQMRSIFDAIRSTFPVDSDAEITVEVNPGTVDKLKLMAYHNIGINRLSIGLQSTDDQELKMLGRIHTYQDFLDTYFLAREAGFQNINVDLMSGIPFQTLGGWEDTIKRVADLAPEHISAYSLIIEEGTPFFERYKDNPPVDEETDRKMYEMTQQMLVDRGYERYEISNYARPRYESRHNTKYWTGEDYLGVGLGASSKIGKFRLKNETDMTAYLEKLGKGETVAFVEENLSDEDEKIEFFILGMRCMSGVSLKKYKERFGEDASVRYGKTIQKICDMGLAAREEDRLFLTAKGIDVSNLVFEMFFM